MTVTVDDAHAENVDSDVSPIAIPPGDASPEPRRDRLRELVARLRAHPETAVTFLVVSACSLTGRSPERHSLFVHLKFSLSKLNRPLPAKKMARKAKGAAVEYVREKRSFWFRRRT